LHEGHATYKAVKSLNHWGETATREFSSGPTHKMG
jgi:hypothetical protein